MDLTLAIISTGGIAFLGYLLAFIFKKTNIPDVLPLVLIGILIGPISGLIDLSFFGQLGPILAVLALILILFEGGMEMNFRELGQSFSRSIILVLATFGTTILVIAPLAKIFFEVPIHTGVLIGLILGSTSSAIILPLMKGLKLSSSTRSILAMETNLSDVLVVILVFGLIGVGSINALSQAGFQFLFNLLISLMIGLAATYAWSKIIGRLREVEHNMFMTPAFLLIIYGLAETLSGNGLLTVFIFAIALGNLEKLRGRVSAFLDGVHGFYFSDLEKKFFSASSFILKTFLFVYIGLSLNLEQTPFLIWGALIMAILFLVRILIIELVLGSAVPSRDLALARGLIPKGVAGIAILAILGDPLMQSLSYPVILFSIIYTSIFVFFAQYRVNDQDPPQPSTLLRPEKIK
jgi:NhaP-type Na+/H+ or K+/H+ antiporter